MTEITRIIQCFVPPMVAGKYTIEVTQQILKNGKDVTLETGQPGIGKSFEFGVDAARFTLNPNDIYSVYPPAGHSGNFSEALPHIVFTRRTLPWERTIDGRLPVFQRDETPAVNRNPQDHPPVPWMAVLLFDEDEIKETRIEKNSISDIIQPATAGITRPEIYNAGAGDGIMLMEWEDPANPANACITIDIVKEQFEKQVPGKSSLAYLAHAKEVSIANKDKNGIKDLNPNGSGVFAVMVGSRLPNPGKQHTALLVSLEGYGDYLEDDGKPALKSIPAGNKVRLAVLANWSFINSGDAGFLSLLMGTEIRSMKIQKAGIDKVLEKYFNYGYAPLEHLTRIGATTMSWYHGPFVPGPSPKMSKNIAFSSADAALRYDKSTGFFDISFSAAWQLGRMLALQNQGFSKAILGWHTRRRQLEFAAIKQQAINQLLGTNSTNAVEKAALPLKYQVVEYLAALARVDIKNDDQMQSAALREPEPSPEEIPPDVKNFIADLYRLNGVPFPYLVPHEFYLQKVHENTVNNSAPYNGTLSFFYVDPNWIEALLDGALSIARVNKTDWILDKAMSGEFNKYFSQAGNPIGDQNPELINKDLNITGFLLRSDLVSGWRGLDIKAYNGDNELLPALRFERIDDDIFLGMFHGNIASIVITQPYEGLHFSIKSNANAFHKELKREDGTNQLVADGTGDVDEEIKNGLVADRIVDVAGLARAMQQKLITKGWMKSGVDAKAGRFTAAEFAYQMVDSPLKYTINVNMISN